MKSRLPLLFLPVLVLGLAGCSSTSTAAKTSSAQGRKASPVVIVTIDSSYDRPNVIVNGFNAGHTPRDIYLEVNEDGTLSYAVTISVEPEGLRSTETIPLSKSYGGGRVPPRKIVFDPVGIHDEGRATDLAKPGTDPTARREETPVRTVQRGPSRVQDGM